jgi:hypothetical protein
MRYLVPLGAVGVLYVASEAQTVTVWSELVILAAAIMVIVSLAALFGGNQKHGR